MAKKKVDFRSKKHFTDLQNSSGRTLPPSEGMRLNKYVAHCGVGSRRQAAEYVKQGMVKVNDQIVKEPYYQVKANDVIKYRDRVIRPEEQLVYYLMNKPKNHITTTKDERGRRTVMDILKGRVKERVFPVGRLDRNTTGLLLLTNDGDLAQKMMHPSYVIKKIYHVKLLPAVKEEHLQEIRMGITLEDGPVAADKIYFLREDRKNEVGIELHIGRNRIVRRIFEHFGYEVKRLDRVFLGGLTKKDLPRGYVRPLSEREIVMLKHFTGKR